MTDEQIVYVDPTAIQADENTRWGLKPHVVDGLMASILEAGRVLSPVEVRTLSPAVNGFKYSLTAGFYRHAAVTRLNEEQGAGMLLPVIVRDVDDKTRLMHQLGENIQRENQSPMDIAVAIAALLAAGVERKEIRRIYARQNGKKGTESAPASNAWVNIMAGLLELPKAIQTRIHNGNIGVAAAYELGKVAPDKRQAVLDRIDAERERQAEAEAKDEEKFLKAESAVTETAEKLTATTAEIETLRADKVAAEAAAKTATAEFKRLSKVDYLSMDEAGKKQHKEALAGAEATVKTNNKAAKDTQNKLASALEKSHKLEEAVTAARERLEAARQAKAKPAKKEGAISPTEVKKAAGQQFVPLTASEMRGAIREIDEESGHPGVAAIGRILSRVFSGELTTKEGVKLLEKLAPKSLKEAGLAAQKAEPPTAEETTAPVQKHGGQGRGKGTKK